MKLFFKIRHKIGFFVSSILTVMSMIICLLFCLTFDGLRAVKNKS